MLLLLQPSVDRSVAVEDPYRVPRVEDLIAIYDALPDRGRRPDSKN